MWKKKFILTIIAIQIKTTLRFHLLVRMAVTKKRSNNKCCPGFVGDKREPSNTVVDNVN